MFSTPVEILAKVAAGALLALLLTLFARIVFPRVCGFQPVFWRAYMAFVIGCVMVVIWNEFVTVVRDRFVDDNLGYAFVWAALFRWLGSIALIIAPTAYMIRDEESEPIGLGSATGISLLAMVMTAPVGLIAFSLTAALMLPRLSH
jgi:hypothetical protein